MLLRERGSEQDLNRVKCELVQREDGDATGQGAAFNVRLLENADALGEAADHFEDKLRLELIEQ